MGRHVPRLGDGALQAPCGGFDFLPLHFLYEYGATVAYGSPKPLMRVRILLLVLLTRKTKKMICEFCKKELKEKGKSHRIFCKENPERKDRSGKNNPMSGKKGSNQYLNGSEMSKETKSKISEKLKNKKLSDSHRKKLSAAMKAAHENGKAWNIGKSRWNNEASYPEKFFMEVIQNEISDKNYEHEYPVGIYSIDFAWPRKKLAIEIDGEQHQRFEEYRKRDNKKDEYLIANGWKILRIQWKEFFHEPKKFISIAKNFILT